MTRNALSPLADLSQNAQYTDDLCVIRDVSVGWVLVESVVQLMSVLPVYPARNPAIAPRSVVMLRGEGCDEVIWGFGSLDVDEDVVRRSWMGDDPDAQERPLAQRCGLPGPNESDSRRAIRHCRGRHTNRPDYLVEILDALT